jgi:hypothetical protein
MPIFKRLAVIAVAVAAILGLAVSNATAACQPSGHHAAAHHSTYHRHAGRKHNVARHHHRPAVGHAPRGCPPGALCAYTGDNYTGHLAWVTRSHSDLRHSPTFHHVRSLYDNSRYRSVTVHSRAYHRGHRLTLRHGTGVRYLGTQFHGHIGSARWHHC